MGFSPEWLALREPADMAARDKGLLSRAVAAAGPRPVVLDLGCGTGSTMRAMAAHLPERTCWRLVDSDPALLSLASAEAAETSVHELDLRRLEALPLEDATLVTASALLDLMPAPWITELAARLAQVRLPFYAALSYDGEMAWDPPLPQDTDVTRAFNRHQRGGKGLGAALGPDAAACAVSALREAGYAVHQAGAPWLLGPQDVPLHRTLVAGIAEAAAEAGEPLATEWGAARAERAAHTRCRIGHLDVLALPPGKP